ncbi:hypothetical protein SDC9_111775 [bioreactor metagenome]|uniref:Helix-turn-helix domain-containing protein n=1 Tax=bioreactor metagenome TaxID=1076179 RepID=A0A645BSW5_9ZZZZ
MSEEPKNLKYVAKPETISSLASLYGLSRTTLRNNIKKLQLLPVLRKERRYIFTVKEVQLIIEHLGEPEKA